MGDSTVETHSPIDSLRDMLSEYDRGIPVDQGLAALVTARAVLAIADRLDALRAEVARLDRGTRHVRRVGWVG